VGPKDYDGGKLEMLAAASRRAWRSFSSIFLGRNSPDRFLVLAGKPIGHTHDNAEEAEAEYNHHDAHNALYRISSRHSLVATLAFTHFTQIQIRSRLRNSKPKRLQNVMAVTETLTQSAQSVATLIGR